MFQTGTVSEIRRWVKARAAGSAPAALPSRAIPAPRHCRQLPSAWLGTHPHLPLPGHFCRAWQEAARVQDARQGTPGIVLPPRPVPRADLGTSSSTAEVEERQGCLPLLPEADGPAGPAVPARLGLLPLLPQPPSLPLHPAPLSPPRPLFPIPGSLVPIPVPLVPIPGRSFPSQDRSFPSPDGSFPSRGRSFLSQGRSFPSRCRSFPSRAARSRPGAVPFPSPHLSLTGAMPCRSWGRAGSALRLCGRGSAGRAGPGSRPGPAWPIQGRRMRRGRGRGAGTPLYRRKRRPTRAPGRGGMRSAGRHRARPSHRPATRGDHAPRVALPGAHGPGAHSSACGGAGPCCWGCCRTTAPWGPWKGQRGSTGCTQRERRPEGSGSPSKVSNKWPGAGNSWGTAPLPSRDAEPGETGMGSSSTRGGTHADPGTPLQDSSSCSLFPSHQQP